MMDNITTCKRRKTMAALLLAASLVTATAGQAPGALNLESWQNPTNMPTPKAQAAAVTDPTTGKIYLVGGYKGWNGSALKSVDVYDPAGNSWSSVAAMSTATRGAAAAYANGKLFVFGGHDSNQLPIVQTYHIATNTWTENSFPAGRWESAAAVANGKIYVFGGEFDPYQYQTIEFDPLSLTSTPRTDMLMGRMAHEAGVIEDKILVVGGAEDRKNARSRVDSYDPHTDIWSTAPASLPTARFHFAGGVLAGHFLAAGGTTTYSNAEFPYLDVFEIYDPGTNSWATGDPLPIGLREAAGAVSGETFYVFGGYKVGGGTSSQVYSATPEPATLGMLALCGLAVLRRRRRRE